MSVDSWSRANPTDRHLHPLLEWRDGFFWLLVARTEMGQGTITTLVTIFADELDVPIDSLRWDHSRYEPTWPDQGTSASVTTFVEFNRYRLLAASLRTWLCAQAADRWGISSAAVATDAGFVLGPGKARLSYAELMELAPQQFRLPPGVPRKSPGKLIGTSPRRLDGHQKSTGSARFGADIRLPGMRFAAWRAAPAGEKLRSVEDFSARAVKGVEQILRFDDGVAVVASNSWIARKAAALITLVSERFDSDPRDSDEISARMEALMAGSLQVIQGSSDAAPPETKQPPLQAVYSIPMLSHAPMEPSVATAQVTGERVHLWLSTQQPERARQAVARALGRPADSVTITKTMVGGGFGRKTYPDVAVLAAKIAARVQHPIQLAFTREDEFAADFFRPPSLHAFTGALADDRSIAFMRHRAVAPSVAVWYETYKSADFEEDGISFAGVANDTYSVAESVAEVKAFRTATRMGIWRSIGQLSSHLARECFMDELAHHAGRDPLEFRLAHLAKEPRTRNVLERVAALSGWKGVADGEARLGVALFREYFPAEPDDPAPYETIVAHVARLEPASSGGWRLARLFAVMDCGRVIHPNLVRAQLEGGVGWALSAMTASIRITGGRPEQTNFDQYAPLRINAMPAIEIEIVESSAWPSGVGEKGVPSVAPAVLNAWFAASGERIRSLPWSRNPLGL